MQPGDRIEIADQLDDHYGSRGTIVAKEYSDDLRETGFHVSLDQHPGLVWFWRWQLTFANRQQSVLSIPKYS